MKEASSVKYPSRIAARLASYTALIISKFLWFIKYRNRENIPHDLPGGLLIAPNHQTYFDPFWICPPVRRRFRFMAWDRAFDWFLIGPLIRYLGAFPVKYEIGGKQAMEESLRSLRDGATLIVFPEGAREFPEGKLLEFKTGAVRIAMQAGVPILPVTVRGGNRVWPQTFKFPHFFRRVVIIYHPLFEIPKPGENNELHHHLKELTVKLREIIESEL